MTLSSYAIGCLTLHPHRQLLHGMKTLRIGGRALDLLSELAAAEGEVLSKDDLFARVWQGVIVDENALQAQVSALRKALGTEAWRLVTVYGRGYRLDLNGCEGEPSAMVRPASIAVMPFESPDREDLACLAEGLAEEVIFALSRIRGLKVVTRRASFAFRGTGLDLREIGRLLGVESVLEGRLHPNGPDLRINVELVSTTSGFHIWCDHLDCSLAEFVGKQEKLALAVASGLGEPEPAGACSLQGTRPVRLVPSAMVQSLPEKEIDRAEVPGFSLRPAGGVRFS